MKRFINVQLLSIIVFFLLAIGCKHEPDPADINNPVDTTGNNTGCSKDTVYFVQQVLPLFQSGCAMSGCHDAVTHEDGVILDSYSNIMSTGRIVPGKPGSSKVYEMMTRTDDERMPPPPAPAANSSQLALISKWITQGAKNNSCLASGCDTTNVKYSTHIKPMVQNYCQGCHSGVAPGGGIDLSTYEGVKAIADNGKFYGSISHLSGYKPMPKNGNKLTNCQITMVKLWINQGAPQN